VFIINGGVLETISQEVRLSGNHDAFNWILGGNYQDDDTLEQQDITLNLSNSLPFFDHAIQDMDGRAKTWAIFGAVGYGLSENVNAQISARYTDSSRRMAGCTRDGGNGKFTDFISLVFSLPPIPPGACGTLNTQTFVPELIRKQFSEDNVSWKASIDWKPVPEAMLYASVTRGYKAGNFVNITAIFSDSLAPVPQEKITAYEMGLKADAFDSNLNLTVNAFYYDYKNKQLTGFSDGGVFGTINAVVSIPESRVIGGELQLSLKVMPGVTLDHSSSYLSTKVNGDFLALDAAGNTEQRRGEAFPGTPKFQMANRVNVDLPVSPSRSIFGNISVVTRSGSKTNFGSDPLFEVPAYTLVNGQIGLGLGRYRVSAFAENIFNKVYHSIVQATGDNVTKVAGLPFQFGARISYKY
jgi:outer membrane receptor protein involved in Fe transport